MEFLKNPVIMPYVLEPKNGANGTILITNKKSYLYYPKLKEKIIVVEQTTAVKW